MAIIHLEGLPGNNLLTNFSLLGVFCWLFYNCIVNLPRSGEKGVKTSVSSPEKCLNSWRWFEVLITCDAEAKRIQSPPPNLGDVADHHCFRARRALNRY